MSNQPVTDVTVTLTGTDGNAFSIIGAVTRAMRKGGVSNHDAKLFQTEAMSGDYDHLLATVTKWVTVE